MSVVVFFASFPSLAAQYGSCFPIVLRLGRFLALSTMRTRVPISGPSMVMSAKMPAVCTPFSGWVLGLADMMLELAPRNPDHGQLVVVGAIDAAASLC